METDNAYRDGVRERDLDNFLIEELSASEDFLDWLLHRVAPSFDEPEGCEVSVRKSPARWSNDGRQTDVEILWSRDGSPRAAILAESKISDGFQPGQVASYQQEISLQQEALGRRSAVAVLVAPSSRLPSLPHGDVFAASISIEEIIAFLEARLDQLGPGELAARIDIRISLLEALAGKRHYGTWNPVPVSEKVVFAAAYESLANQRLPHLQVSPTVGASNAKTRLFTGMNIRELPKMTLRHEFGKPGEDKYVNVQFPGKGDRHLALEDSGLLSGTPYLAARAGASLAIRARTPGVDPNLPFEAERAKVDEGLQAIQDLLGWIEAHQRELAHILDEA